MESIVSRAEDLHVQRKYDEAEELYTAAIDEDPTNLAKRFGLAKNHHAKGNAVTAVNLYSDILLAPGAWPDAKSNAANNIGIILLDFGKTLEALQSFEIAISLDPNCAAAQNNIGNILVTTGDFQGAREHYETAMRLDGSLFDARMNCGTIQLTTGDFINGWKNYEYRFKTPSWQTRPIDDPRRWKGEDLAGKRLLLSGEQGLGDAIMGIRYAPLIRERFNPAKLLYHGHRETHELFEYVKGGFDSRSCVVDPNDIPSEDYDYHCPLFSLPAIFETTLENVPSNPYIAVTDDFDFGPTEALKVGLVWAGNPGHKLDALRSINPELLEPLRRMYAVDFFSLQVGKRSGECPDWVTDLSPKLANLTDTASALQSLDLLISVDTSVVHLAGAVGCPTWMLTPFSPDWRWMLERDDSPWYPDLTLFRQQTKGDWLPVIARIRKALHDHP
jgi:tetratricopeptide (TPR) repeat protein